MNYITGDQIITRSMASESEKILASLPKEVKEQLIPAVTRFHGLVGEESEKWLEKTQNFARINDFSMSSVFGFLFADDAKVLWESFVTDKKLKDTECIEWFKEKFVNKRKLLQIFEELVTIEQSSGERFETFEIRVSKLVEKALSGTVSKEELVKEILCKKVKSTKLKDAFIMKEEITVNEMKVMAQTIEKQQECNESVPEKISYAAAIREDRNGSQVNNNRMQNDFQRHYVNNTHRNNGNYTNIQRNTNNRRYPDVQKNGNTQNYNGVRNTNNNQSYSRERPTHSMKYLAKREYYKSLGRPAPAECKLGPHDCFCCGEHGHKKQDCPMKNKCLICGKSGHFYKRCYRLRNSQIATIDEIKINSVIEDDITVEELDEINALHHEVKNVAAPTAHISSVGSN